MRNINDGGPAFPRPQAETSQGGNYEQDGMSLRDWFAGQALPVFLTELYAQSARNRVKFENVFNSAALASYELADAMLVAREDQGGN